MQGGMRATNLELINICILIYVLALLLTRYCKESPLVSNFSTQSLRSEKETIRGDTYQTICSPVLCFLMGSKMRSNPFTYLSLMNKPSIQNYPTLLIMVSHLCRKITTYHFLCLKWRTNILIFPLPWR